MNHANITQLVAESLLVLIPMLLSLTVHEFAHAWVARCLGDDTAQRLGRLTLNPLAHADPVGTFFLPLMILVTNGSVAGGHLPFIGWARPVPIDGSRFTPKVTWRTGNMLVAIAGPLSNLLIAMVCAALLSADQHGVIHGPLPAFLHKLLVQMLFINIGLCVFNLLPIYPLDGEKVLSGLLSPQHAYQLAQLNRAYGSWLLLGVVFFARDILSYPVQLVAQGILSIVGLT